MICIVQARMNSRRLNGKVLRKIRKIVLLDRVISQLKKASSITHVIIATSDKSFDQEIVKFCKKREIAYFCGSLSNVYDRFIQIVKQKKMKSFVRICADSPAISPQLINFAVKIFKSGNFDIVTNTFPRTFPIGLSVEVISSKVFLNSYKNITKKQNKEHITSYFYENSKKYKIYNISNKVNYSSLTLAIDTDQDLKYMRQLFKKYNSVKIIYDKLGINLDYF